MPIVISVLASLGGIVTFITAVWIAVRSIFAQTTAIRDNTQAIQELTKQFNTMDNRLNIHGERIATLEGWRRNGAK